MLFISIVLLIGLSSCGSKESDSFSDVSLSEIKNFRVVCEGYTYNCKLSFDGDAMVITFYNNGKTFDGTKVTIDSQKCVINYDGLEKVFRLSALPEDFFPVMLYKFCSITGTDFKTEHKNKKSDEEYISRNVDGDTVRLTVKGIGNNENVKYSINITR